MTQTIDKTIVNDNPLGDDELQKTHAYWRACNYLAAGMIYLQANPLLRKPLHGWVRVFSMKRNVKSPRI